MVDQVNKLDDVYASENEALIIYKKRGRDRSSCKKSNIPLASCVTASARTYLYREGLEKIKDPSDVLYMDTGQYFPLVLPFLTYFSLRFRHFRSR